jgi:hypothetical protein
MMGFKAFHSAQATIAGIETAHMIRKGQLSEVEKVCAFKADHDFILCTLGNKRGIISEFEEIMEERGFNVDHATLNRWIIRYAPAIAAKAHLCLRQNQFLPLAWAGMPKTSFRKNSDSPRSYLGMKKQRPYGYRGLPALAFALHGWQRDRITHYIT